MISAALAAALTRENHHEVLLRNRKRLEWATKVFRDLGPSFDETYGEFVQAILNYHKTFNKCPTLKELHDYCLAEGHQPNVPGMDWELLQTQFPEVEQWEAAKDQTIYEMSEIEPLLPAYVKQARKIYHVNNGRTYTSLAGGNVEVKTKPPRKATVEDAVHYMRKQWSKDLKDELIEPAGLLHENTDELIYSLDEIRKSEEGTRITTAWDHVDDVVLIGPKYNSYIGIAAYPNHGKSTTALTFAFNCVIQNLNVLFVTLEHSPKSMWQRFAFMYAGKYVGQLGEMANLQQWNMQPDSITKEDMSRLAVVIEDIKNRRFPDGTTVGRIDFQNMRDWESIMVYLEDAHRREHVDVLIVDYISDLDLPGVDPRFRDSAIEDIFRQGQTLTRTFDNGRGIVLVSPVQIKKSAKEAADKMSIEDAKLPVRYTLDGISQYSKAIQRMDYIFSMYQNEVLRKSNQVQMDTLKVREGPFPESRIMEIDEFTRLVCNKSAGGKLGSSRETEKAITAIAYELTPDMVS